MAKLLTLPRRTSSSTSRTRSSGTTSCSSAASASLPSFPQPHVHVALPPPLATGPRNKLLTSSSLVPAPPPSAHYSETLGPAQLPAKAILNGMHLGNATSQTSDQLAHLQCAVAHSLNQTRDLQLAPLVDKSPGASKAPAASLEPTPCASGFASSFHSLIPQGLDPALNSREDWDAVDLFEDLRGMLDAYSRRVPHEHADLTATCAHVLCTTFDHKISRDPASFLPPTTAGHDILIEMQNLAHAGASDDSPATRSTRRANWRCPR